MSTQLHLPPGINYECTGCGKCCGGWVVAMTEEDYDRISQEDWSDIHESYSSRPLFRQLTKREAEGTPYTHKIVSETGVCPFLVNNLCHMHSKRGSTFKPSICQVFPYSFTETPSGVYATVSYVSVGALYNSGLPLAQQEDVLQQKWLEFKQLHPHHKPDWSTTKLTVDQPLNWDDYLALEEKLLEILADTSVSLEQRLIAGSQHLVSHVKGQSLPPSGDVPASDIQVGTAYSAPLKPIDLSLLLTFHKMYFPTKPLKRGEGDFNAMRLAMQHFFGNKLFHLPGRSFALEQLQRVAWPTDPEITGILDRYIYSFVFGKKYFGAGFGQVSVVAGYHHLVLITALIKLQSKASALMRDSSVVNLLDVASTVRQMERQVGETRLGGYAAAAWELLLFAPGRARRLLANS